MKASGAFCPLLGMRGRVAAACKGSWGVMASTPHLTYYRYVVLEFKCQAQLWLMPSNNSTAHTPCERGPVYPEQ